ncbi:MAG: electron transport complex subunit RsxC [Bacteroidetes bacterium]|nr:electron transport complex subunit RsxC [Bacteroidota bacterium]
MTLKTFKLGGIHPPEHKISAGKAIELMPIPTQVSIPLGQVLGVPSIPIVKRGDQVQVGQLIGKGEAFISAQVHSSVSGKVLKVDGVPDSSGYRRNAVLIEVEGDDWTDGIDRSTELNRNIRELTQSDIIEKIKSSGIVGLGGATFPSHVKLMVPKGKVAEVLLINGVECEPYLTSDHRLMLERGEELLVGCQILMKGLGVDRAIIGIENNKMDAIDHLASLIADYPGISIQALKVQYPQGGEKQLIKACINREVPSGKLPIEVGAVVNNVGTAFAVYEAVQKNKPLIERIVTVAGKSLMESANFQVRIGTPISQLIEKVGGLPEDTGKVISGGPMMGKALNSLEVPVVKGTSGILIMNAKEAKRSRAVNCIRCGKCTAVCPMGLEPFYLAQLAKYEDYSGCEKNRIMDCIECGSCMYTCPSYRPLLDYIRLGKTQVGKLMRSRQN